MTIHIISTINGQQNEGMRNIATHIGKVLEKSETVIYSSFRDVLRIPFRCVSSDITMIFARCNSKIYYMTKMCCMFCKNVFVVMVQRPDAAYIKRNSRHPLKCHYFSICRSDADEIKLSNGCCVYDFCAGINTIKFSPVGEIQRTSLKRKYGVSTDKPLVVHVGHCSVGRGLEDFAEIDGEQFERLVVASGMFENDQIKNLLHEHNIRLLTGYIHDVNEIYQMADVYLFPTQSDEFVISVPLSVMEALACGTPVVAYKSFQKLCSIQGVSPQAITLMGASEELHQALVEALKQKDNRSLLENAKSWEAVVSEMLEKIQNC